MTLYALDGNSPELPSDGDFWIAPDANAIGRVKLGSGVSVWFGATLRGDNEEIRVGRGSNVQENVVMHVDPGFPLSVGENCTIGHKAMLHGCSVGDRTLVGMGATVLNGARIGRDCLIGAGALVTKGREIPDGSLVIGAPGKAVRELDAKEIAGLLDSAKHYQERMRMYRDGLAVA